MESYITLSFLNDFIFCPRSIYFHQLYGGFHDALYKQTPQYKGNAAHETIDRQIKRAYGLGQIKEEDFVLQKGQYQLEYKKSKEYTRWLLQSILDCKSDIFLYCQQYYRCFIREKPITDYPVFDIENLKME